MHGAAHLMVDRKQRERDGEEGAGTCMSLVTYFLQPDPIS
jgi:hypothetical protein